MKGKVIDQYTLHELIGKGQYSSVYKAEHQSSQQNYAIKVMNLEKFKSIEKLKNTIKR